MYLSTFRFLRCGFTRFSCARDAFETTSAGVSRETIIASSNMRSAQNSGSRGMFGDMASLLKHLPHYQEPTALILHRGHLLVEELLRGYIDRKLPNPSAFKHDQFLFAKVLMLCRALTPPKVESWAFDAAKKLNDVRNEVAHELDRQRCKTSLRTSSASSSSARRTTQCFYLKSEAKLASTWPSAIYTTSLYVVLHAKES